MDFCRLHRGTFRPKLNSVKRGAVFGNLDGFHLGHQALLEQLSDWQRKDSNRESMAISLYPHPLTVLNSIKIARITSIRQDLRILTEAGIDLLQLIRFSTEFAKLSARDFITSVLIKGLSLDFILIGEDARVGRNAEGTAEEIVSIFKKYGKEAKIVEFTTQGQNKIGSRTIRDLIQSGKIKEANLQLGRPFAIEGKVIHGDNRGKQIGYPSANIDPADYVLPKNGVYISEVCIGNKFFQAATNIGNRPTFTDDKKILLETHLLNTDQIDLYSKRIEVRLLEFIRCEKKFSSAEELKKQISDDIEKCQDFFSKIVPG